MNNLFENTDKIVKFNRSTSEELQIKNVLNPYNQMLIDEQRAKELGIISNGYYRNGYGGLIPLHIAASKGFVECIANDHIEIEYRSKSSAIIANLTVQQVYDSIQQCMISCRQAIDRGYLNLELFLYINTNFSITIHEAFYRGLIIGELRTKTIESKAMIYENENPQYEYDNLFSSLTNIVNSLSEFRNTVHITDDCELTSDGFIRQKQSGKRYLLTQAIECGFVSIKDISIKTQLDLSENQSTLVNETMPTIMNITHDEDEMNPYFSDTFILDILKATAGGGGGSMDDTQNCDMHFGNMKRALQPINTC